MLLRWKIPADIMLVGPTQESLEVHAYFEIHKLICTLSFPGESVPINNTSSDLKFFRSADYIEIVVEDPNNSFQKWISGQNYNELNLNLIEISNRFLRGIRNFGIAAHLNEIRELNVSPDENLENWNVQIKESDKDWHPVKPIDLSEALIRSRYNYNVPKTTSALAVIRVNFWAEIQKGILEDLSIPPEREFTTNSIEHMQNKNYRLAVVESIIGLEIVFSRYLSEYMRVNKKLSKKQIDEFLSPEFGLTARLAGILHLTLKLSDLEKIDLNKVRMAVNWRNKIVHRTGHLPSSIKSEEIESCIFHVISLSLLLANKTDKINTLQQPIVFSPFSLKSSDKSSG